MNATNPSRPSPALLNLLCPLRPVPDCPEIKARRADNVYELWQAWEKDAGRECPVPHWAVVWPAARVLARYLLDHPETVKHKQVLEIGCGGAVASISAKMSGAGSVSANDIDPVSLAVARENASANGVKLLFDAANWIASESAPPVDLVLIADFFYLKTDSRLLTAQLRDWKSQGLGIIIADGGRAFVPHEHEKILHVRDLAVDQDLEGKSQRPVRLFKF